MKNSKKIKLIEILKNHVMQNYREYMIIIICFITGIFLGVFFVNNMEENQKIEIHTYLTEFIENLRNAQNINLIDILQTSLKDKIILTLCIWFFATTIVGIPIVFGIVVYRGFCLGYTISAIISLMGFTKGFIFILITLILQNIILIPTLIGLSVSGFKFYKAIIKDRRKENIKIEFMRHTVFSGLMLLILCISCIIEVFISTNLIKSFIKYF